MKNNAKDTKTTSFGMRVFASVLAIIMIIGSVAGALIYILA